MRPRTRQKPKSSFGEWAVSAIAIAGMTAPVAIVSSASAAVLHGWSFNPANQALTLTLPSGITPKFFLLAEPARIVLEIPDTTLGSIPSEEAYRGAVRSIRLSEVSGGSRVVIELAPNTRLDPRHADLTATELDNGQTRWTLLPLLQDAPTAPIATAPPEPVVPAATVPPTPPPAVAPPEPTTATPPATDNAPAPSAEPTELVEAAEPTESAENRPAPVDTAGSESAADETVAIADETHEESSAPITVTPSPGLPEMPPETAPEQPALPDIATSATTGAARSLPTGPDPLEGVSTDAAALDDVASDNLSDLPPEQIPRDPFAAASQRAAVSVPSLSEADSTPAPAVAVPPLANVPDAPATAQQPNASAAPSTGLPANQVRPPQDRGVVAAPTANPADNALPPRVQPPANAEPAAIAANSLEMPPVPLPPADWGANDAATAAASQVRPPTATAPATDPIATSPPPPIVNSPAATVVPPPVPASASVDAPPFLPSSPPAANASPPPIERPSIPPPPNVPSADGTLPFGAPLPQTKSLGDVSSPATSSYRSVLPVGARLSLQYVGTDPLVLSEQEPVYEVLILTDNVYDPATGALLLPSGGQVLGRFEGVDDDGRRFIAQSVTYGQDRLPLLVESDWLAGVMQPNGLDVALGSSIGAAAVTILAGFSGIGLLGGAAVGAVAGLAEAPTLVTIEPGMTIEVEVVSEVQPFN